MEPSRSSLPTPGGAATDASASGDATARSSVTLSHTEVCVQAGLCSGRGLRSSGGHGTKLGTTLLLRRVQLKSRGKWGQDSNFGSQNIWICILWLFLSIIQILPWSSPLSVAGPEFGSPSMCSEDSLHMPNKMQSSWCVIVFSASGDWVIFKLEQPYLDKIVFFCCNSWDAVWYC